MHGFLKFSLGMTVLLALVYIYSGQSATKPFLGHGDPETLSKVYQRWKSGYEQQGAVEVLRLGLNYSRAESTDFTIAQGQAALNLLNGELQVDVQGLAAGGQYEVWLLDKQNKAAVQQNQRKVGALAFNDGRHSLHTWLDSAEFTGFTLDSVAVSKADANPQNGGLLFGTPSLMQRIYYSERYWPLTEVVQADGLNHCRQAVHCVGDVAVAAPVFRINVVGNNAERSGPRTLGAQTQAQYRDRHQPKTTQFHNSGFQYLIQIINPHQRK